MKSGKVWGETKQILQRPNIEVHHLNILPNSFCSVHKHDFKWNGFFVVRGSLQIEVTKNDYDLTDTTVLNAGEFMAVKPGEFHCFKTDEQGAECLEVYYPPELSEDIVRKTVGGRSVG